MSLVDHPIGQVKPAFRVYGFDLCYEVIFLKVFRGHLGLAGLVKTPLITKHVQVIISTQNVGCEYLLIPNFNVILLNRRYEVATSMSNHIPHETMAFITYIGGLSSVITMYMLGNRYIGLGEHAHTAYKIRPSGAACVADILFTRYWYRVTMTINIKY